MYFNPRNFHFVPPGEYYMLSLLRDSIMTGLGPKLLQNGLLTTHHPFTEVNLQVATTQPSQVI